MRPRTSSPFGDELGHLERSPCHVAEQPIQGLGRREVEGAFLDMGEPAAWKRDFDPGGIDRDDLGAAIDGDLGPASGGRAEINAQIARLRTDPDPVDRFLQLQSGAGWGIGVAQEDRSAARETGQSVVGGGEADQGIVLLEDPDLQEPPEVAGAVRNMRFDDRGGELRERALKKGLSQGVCRPNGLVARVSPLWGYDLERPTFGAASELPPYLSGYMLGQGLEIRGGDALNQAHGLTRKCEPLEGLIGPAGPHCRCDHTEVELLCIRREPELIDQIHFPIRPGQEGPTGADRGSSHGLTPELALSICQALCRGVALQATAAETLTLIARHRPAIEQSLSSH